MSTHVVTEFRTQPARADELVALLTAVLPDSLAHDGCEAIRLRRDQDDRNHIVSFTQWTTRQHYIEYPAWRTDAGTTDEVGDMLTEPMKIEYFDELVTATR